MTTNDHTHRISSTASDTVEPAAQIFPSPVGLWPGFFT